MIYLDTHVVVWLHANRKSAFPRRARKVLDAEDLFISGAVYLEMQYLFETGKIRSRAEEIFSYLERQIGLKLSDVPLAIIGRKAASLSWTRDPFNRLIVGEAEVADSRLLTRDRDILDHYPRAIWE